MVDCLTVAAGILARSEGVIEGTGADQRFVKKRFQKCGVSSFFLINISSYLLSDSYMQHYLQIRIYNTPQISPSLSSYIYSHDKTPDDTS